MHLSCYSVLVILSGLINFLSDKETVMYSFFSSHRSIESFLCELESLDLRKSFVICTLPENKDHLVMLMIFQPFFLLFSPSQHVMNMSDDDPRRLDEIRKYAAIYGRFDCKRKPEKPLTLHEVRTFLSNQNDDIINYPTLDLPSSSGIGKRSCSTNLPSHSCSPYSKR